MHFGRYLLSKQREEWADSYLDYKGLKGLIKAVVAEERKVCPPLIPQTVRLRHACRAPAQCGGTKRLWRPAPGPPRCWRACRGRPMI